MGLPNPGSGSILKSGVVMNELLMFNFGGAFNVDSNDPANPRLSVEVRLLVTDGVLPVDDLPRRFALLGAGASGFLLKDAPPADLVAAVRTVASGDAVVSPRITRRMTGAAPPVPT